MLLILISLLTLYSIIAELGYNIMTGTEYFVPLQPGSVMLWLTVTN
jgi:hypothetical protein